MSNRSKRFGLDLNRLYVPKSRRHVDVEEHEPGRLALSASFPSDIVNAAALALWGNRTMESLEIAIGMTDSPHGRIQETFKDWHDLLIEVITHVKPLQGQGLLILKPSLEEPVDNVLRALESLYSKLNWRGIRHVMLDMSENTNFTMSAISRLKRNKWRHRIHGPTFQLISPANELEISIHLSTNGSFLNVPGTERRVTMEEDGDRKLRISSNGPNDIYQSSVLEMWGNKSLETIEITTDQTGGLFGDIQNSESFEDWQKLFRELVKQTKSLQGRGLLILKPSLIDRIDEILYVLGNLYSNLHKHGIKEVNIDVTENTNLTSLSIIEMKKKMWKVKTEDKTFQLTAPSNELVINILFSANRFCFRIPWTERHVAFEEVDGNNIKITSNGPLDIYRSEVLSMLGERSLESIYIAADQTGGLFGIDENSESDEYWGDLFRQLFQRTETFQGRSLLILKPCRRGRADKILLALEKLFSKFHEHGIRYVIFDMTENINWPRAKMKDLHSQNWRLEPNGQTCFLTAPNGLEINMVFVPKLSHFKIPGAQRHVIATYEHDFKHLTIVSNGPVDICSSSVLRVWGQKNLAVIDIFTDKTGGLYGDSPNRETMEDWQNMFLELVKQTETLQDDGLLVVKPRIGELVGEILHVLGKLYSVLSGHGVRHVMLHVSKSSYSQLEKVAINSIKELVNQQWTVEWVKANCRLTSPTHGLIITI